MENRDMGKSNEIVSNESFSAEIDEEILVMAHLEGFEEFRDEDQVPYAMTPRGITKAVGITESAPYNTLEDIESKGLIEEDVRDIIGSDRERNIYLLTEKGKDRFYSMWNQIKDEKVTFKTKKEEKDLLLKEVEKHISDRNPITRGLRSMNEEKIIDLTGFEDEVEVFVGRKKELDTLKKHLKEVKRSGSRTVLVEGEAGIGKTSLMSRLKPYAQEFGFDFLVGTCQSQTSDPYLPFKEAFTDYIRGKKEDSNRESMAFIGTAQDEVIEDRELFDAKKSETFYETTEAVREIAESNPLVVFLDDLQWVDKGTLDILAYMDDRLEDVPVFFIGAYRPEEVDENHYLMDMIHRLGRDARIEKIELKPFTKKDTEETIKGFLGVEDPPEYFVENIHKKTDGNPLFIKEALRQMREEGLIDSDKEEYPKRSEDIAISEKVHNVIQRRLKQLDDETKRVVEIGSIIGDKIPFDLLSKTADIDEIDLLDHIDMLTGNQLWEEKTDEEAFFFSHEMIKTTVNDGLKPLKRKLLHKRVAQNIEELYEEELKEWYPDLARHYEIAEEPQEALDYYIKAGEKAESMFANEDAIEMYERAMDLADETGKKEIERVEIIEKIANAYSLLGEYEDTREYLEKALELIEDEEKAKIRRKIALTYKEQGSHDEVIECVDKGISNQEETTSETCRLLSLKGWAYMKIGEHELAEEQFKKEKELLDEIEEDKVRGQVYHDLGTLSLRRGNLEKGIEKLKQAIQIREEVEDKEELQKSYNNIGGAYVYNGNIQKGEEYFRKSLEVCEEIGHTHGTSSSYHNLADMQMRKGKLTDARSKFNKSLDIAEKIGDVQGIANAHTNLAEVYTKLGELKKSEEHLEKSQEIRKDMGDKYWTSVDTSIKATIHLKKGEFKKAEEKTLESLDLSEEIGSKRRVALNRLKLGKIHRYKGEFGEAKKHQEKALGIAEKIGISTIKARIEDELGRTNVKLGEIGNAKGHHERGLEIGREIEDEEAIILNLLGLAEDALKKNDMNEAKKYIDKASSKVKAREEYPLEVRENFVIGKISVEEDDFEKAEKSFNTALEKSVESNDKPWEAKIKFALSLMYLEKGHIDEAESHLDEALKLFSDMNMKYWMGKVNEIKENEAEIEKEVIG